MKQHKSGTKETESGSVNKVISRKVFLRDISLFSLFAVAGSFFLKGCTTGLTSTAAPQKPPADIGQSKSPVAPPAQPAASQFSLMEAIKNRKSASGFLPQPLPKETLMELLWAAWGINRPESGKRTAPSAINAQEIDIYLLTVDGAYLYDAKNSQMVSLIAQDLRASAAQGSLKDAPVHLVYVADYSRVRPMAQSQRDMYSAAHTGFIGQNVYLYCASQGIGARFYAGVNRDAVKSALKLGENQAVIFAQAVGYPR